MPVKSGRNLTYLTDRNSTSTSLLTPQCAAWEDSALWSDQSVPAIILPKAAARSFIPHLYPSALSLIFIPQLYPSPLSLNFIPHLYPLTLSLSFIPHLYPSFYPSPLSLTFIPHFIPHLYPSSLSLIFIPQLYPSSLSLLFDGQTILPASASERLSVRHADVANKKSVDSSSDLLLPSYVSCGQRAE
ncbi:hypothetical protein NHX12_006720 [Muraenolepis orangiensis]|uniref:Uncharacterized protein n=1 Tax=Muraenolepis orangiensis TaxID=630683 RepID=A0A9Q0DS22_9TELE|nr:hypothetical protein NHX12_006720 [Muraenolepis orangiensis]